MNRTIFPKLVFQNVKIVKPQMSFWGVFGKLEHNEKVNFWYLVTRNIFYQRRNETSPHLWDKSFLFTTISTLTPYRSLQPVLGYYYKFLIHNKFIKV